ncbi:hypothetical protein [Stappia indica]|uniref:DUF1440 domain-containing protein n=1 Tax=Stappia indica TaxID=538381 RepID=A0A857CAN4_9HYPH|nr:hypothetical protein [Stappia indica]QGZ35949.1 hypothetical protein GH266_16505 [Stappia indica]
MQSHAAPAAAAASFFPPLTLATLVTALIAGVLADGTWEFWARVITPLWVGGPLQPAALVQSVFGFSSFALAEAIHLVVGVVFYPLGYLFIAKPIADRFLPFLPWPVVALGYGVGLWIFALYIMAHLFAGLPPFLNFITLTWASLIGHLLFGLVVGIVVRWRMPA